MYKLSEKVIRPIVELGSKYVFKDLKGDSYDSRQPITVIRGLKYGEKDQSILNFDKTIVHGSFQPSSSPCFKRFASGDVHESCEILAEVPIDQINQVFPKDQVSYLLPEGRVRCEKNCILSYGNKIEKFSVEKVAKMITRLGQEYDKIIKENNSQSNIIPHNEVIFMGNREDIVGIIISKEDYKYFKNAPSRKGFSSLENSNFRRLVNDFLVRNKLEKIKLFTRDVNGDLVFAEEIAVNLKMEKAYFPRMGMI